MLFKASETFLLSNHILSFCVCTLSEDCSEIFSDVQSAAVNPLNDDFESLMGTLGLSERKPVPDPVLFDETDPLGAGLMTTSDTDLRPYIGLGKILDTSRSFIRILCSPNFRRGIKQQCCD